MKKALSILLWIYLLNPQNVFSQVDSLLIKGVVVEKKGSTPLQGASISVVNKRYGTLTDDKGRFVLKVIAGDLVKVDFIGYKSITQKIDKPDQPMLIALEQDDSGINYLVVNAVSNKSYWSGASMGASIGYNVNSKGGTDNIVGGATVIINPMSHKYSKTEWAIVGNIANFMNTVSTQVTKTDLSKLAQSNNGLSVGIGGTREFQFGVDNELAFRVYGFTLYQLNSFQKTGDTTHTSISQWKNTLGLELEGFTFKQGGAMTFGVSANYGIFDANAYKTVFGEKKAKIFSLESTVILPLSNQFGFLFSGTYSRSFQPIFMLGIIIKTIDFDKTSLGAAQRH